MRQAESVGRCFNRETLAFIDTDARLMKRCRAPPPPPPATRLRAEFDGLQNGSTEPSSSIKKKHILTANRINLIRFGGKSGRPFCVCLCVALVDDILASWQSFQARQGEIGGGGGGLMQRQHRLPGVEVSGPATSAADLCVASETRAESLKVDDSGQLAASQGNDLLRSSAGVSLRRSAGRCDSSIDKTSRRATGDGVVAIVRNRPTNCPTTTSVIDVNEAYVSNATTRRYRSRRRQPREDGRRRP